jgi:hypothetical protein
MLHVKGPLVLQQRVVVLNGVLRCLVSFVLTIMLSIPIIIFKYTLIMSLCIVFAFIVFFSAGTQVIIVPPA